MKTSRGLRNNNPLNIRRNSTKWKGLSAEQNDKSFFVFTGAEWGYRAAFITLKNYKLLHGLSTIEEWVHRWAPPCENDTQTYTTLVRERSGFPSNLVPDINSFEQMSKIVSAMSYMENGKEPILEDIRQGWSLI